MTVKSLRDTKDSRKFVYDPGDSEYPDIQDSEPAIGRVGHDGVEFFCPKESMSSERASGDLLTVWTYDFYDGRRFIHNKFWEEYLFQLIRDLLESFLASDENWDEETQTRFLTSAHLVGRLPLSDLSEKGSEALARWFRRRLRPWPRAEVEFNSTRLVELAKSKEGRADFLSEAIKRAPKSWREGYRD